MRQKSASFASDTCLWFQMTLLAVSRGLKSGMSPRAGQTPTIHGKSGCEESQARSFHFHMHPTKAAESLRRWCQWLCFTYTSYSSFTKRNTAVEFSVLFWVWEVFWFCCFGSGFLLLLRRVVWFWFVGGVFVFKWKHSVDCFWIFFSIIVPIIFSFSSFPVPPDLKIIHHYRIFIPTNKPLLNSAILYVSFFIQCRKKSTKKDTRCQKQQKVTDTLRGM